jgi:aspartate/methionine/tyrosine aminotransferase
MKIPPFKLERFFARYEFNAPYLLSSSDCESVTVQDILNLEPGAEGRFHDLGLGYTESAGSPELRTRIAGLYTDTMTDSILVFSGAEEGIFVCMNSLLESGDHVIVHTPCYQSLFEVARAIGCEVTPWRGDEANGWALDLDALAHLIRPSTKLIVINCPHNPTGYLMSHTDQARLIALARRTGIYIFSDEVYRELEHDPATRLPAMCDLYERGISLGVMSKTYGLAGLRMGWLATRDRDVYRALAEYKDYTSICSSAPSEFLSIVALQHRDSLIARNLEIIRRNLDLLDSFFATYPDRFVWQRPTAGSIAFPRLCGDEDVETFCVNVVESVGVMLLPGTCYEADSHNFRIGFGRANLPTAIDRLGKFLNHIQIDH